MAKRRLILDILVCLNGVSQYVVEVKSLTQDIIDSTDFYKQTLSYAHSKEKTFAILTNFRYFVILRCDVEVDNPLKAAIKVIDIEDYTEDDIDLLYNFSKEIWIEKGEENPLYLKLANFKRRAKVDVELLKDLKEWRQSVINNIKKHPRHNKYDFSDEKTKYEVEEEIQRLIDRLIFICYTEDKGFIDPELKSLIELKKDKYYASQSWLLDKIRNIFKKYWNEYNSDLFKQGECDKFFVEDGVLLNILTDLRKPKDKLPYDFSSIEADILGKTYENFIGHVLAGEKRFKEKESKGKRKSEGIYYTPTYIVKYIVDNTLREYIKGKSFASINKVKIVDPACGSGSFLIKAFDALVEKSKNILKRELNYEEKKNLMLNCIFGVDKDERAVDICRLNSTTMIFEDNPNFPLKFILAIINSRLMNRYYRLIYTDVNVKPAYLSELPIHEADDSTKRSILNLSNKMLSLNKRLNEIGDKNTLENQKIEQEIKKTDNEIDELVYQLYGITEEEKEIIEESIR